MGITLSAFFALGLALLSYIQGRSDASQAGLDQFIFGQAAAIVWSDVQLISGVGLIAFAIVAFFWKEFKLITFDYEFAAANGFPVRFYDILLSTLVVVAIVLGLQLAGVILMVGLLIAPGVAARQWTNRLDQMMLLSGIFGAFAGSTGAIISAVDTNMPTGPLIIVVASLIVFLSIGFAPERGLVWAAWKRRQDRINFAARNLLQDIETHGLSHDDVYYPMPLATLVALRGAHSRRVLAQLEGDGLAKRQGDHVVLTPHGLDSLSESAYEAAPSHTALPELQEANDG